MCDHNKQDEQDLSFKKDDEFEIYIFIDKDRVLAIEKKTNFLGIVLKKHIIFSSENEVKDTNSLNTDKKLYHEGLRTDDLKTGEVHKNLMPTKTLVLGNSTEKTEKTDKTDKNEIKNKGFLFNFFESKFKNLPFFVEKNNVNNSVYSYDGEFFTWSVLEINKGIKKPALLSVSNKFIILKSNHNSKNTKSFSSSLNFKYEITDDFSFYCEKKKLFFEFKNPSIYFELKISSKDLASAIVCILNDLKKSYSKTVYQDKHKSIDLTNDVRTSSGFHNTQKKFNNKLNSDLIIFKNGNINKKAGELKTFDKIADENVEKIYDINDNDVKNNINSSFSSNNTQQNLTFIKAKKKFPDMTKIRKWSDVTNLFKVDAELLGYSDGKVYLHKTSGVKISVMANKLSINDLKFVESVIGVSMKDHIDQIVKQKSKKTKNSEIESDVSLNVSNSNLKTDSFFQFDYEQSEQFWFNLFLASNIKLGFCQRYSLNFANEKLDEYSINDLSPSLLRSLGLNEDDIIKLLTHLDKIKQIKKDTLFESKVKNDYSNDQFSQTEKNNGLILNDNKIFFSKKQNTTNKSYDVSDSLTGLGNSFQYTDSLKNLTINESLNLKKLDLTESENKSVKVHTELQTSEKNNNSKNHSPNLIHTNNLDQLNPQMKLKYKTDSKKDLDSSSSLFFQNLNILPNNNSYSDQEILPFDKKIVNSSQLMNNHLSLLNGSNINNKKMIENQIPINQINRNVFLDKTSRTHIYNNYDYPHNDDFNNLMRYKHFLLNNNNRINVSNLNIEMPILNNRSSFFIPNNNGISNHQSRLSIQTNANNCITGIQNFNSNNNEKLQTSDNPFSSDISSLDNFSKKFLNSQSNINESNNNLYLSPQLTGKRANVYIATPDNPFGL